MRAWVMACCVNDDGSRPSMREALEVAEIHLTRAECLAAAAGVLDGPEWQPVQIEVRMLTKLRAPSDRGER